MWQRIVNHLERRIDLGSSSSQRRANHDVSEVLQELGIEANFAEFSSLWKHLHQQAVELNGNPGLGVGSDADERLSRLVYAICRQTEFTTVVETGVSRGVTSRVVLEAFDERTDDSRLYSIDLKPYRKELAKEHRAFVPSSMEDRWVLRIGTSRRLLPMTCRQLGAVDLFIHDSLHTYRNMTSEMYTVWPFLRRGGVMLVDDASDNEAFDDFEDRMLRAVFRVPYKRKEGYFGVAVKQ